MYSRISVRLGGRVQGEQRAEEECEGVYSPSLDRSKLLYQPKLRCVT